MFESRQKVRLECVCSDGDKGSFEEEVRIGSGESGSQALGHSIGYALLAMKPYVNRGLWMKDFVVAMLDIMELDAEQVLTDPEFDSSSVPGLPDSAS
jgi:hypothetical protein